MKQCNRASCLQCNRLYGLLADSSDNNMRVPLARWTLRPLSRMTELPPLGTALGSRLMSSRPNTPRLEAKRVPLLLSPPTASAEGLSSSCRVPPPAKVLTSSEELLFDALTM